MYYVSLHSCLVLRDVQVLTILGGKFISKKAFFGAPKDLELALFGGCGRPLAWGDGQTLHRLGLQSPVLQAAHHSWLPLHKMYQGLRTPPWPSLFASRDFGNSHCVPRRKQ